MSTDASLAPPRQDADVIALVHLQPQATQEIVPAGSTVN